MGREFMMQKSGRGGAFAKTEWRTVALIVLCYGVWFAAGMWLWPAAPAAALAIMALTVALQSSLMHEVLHGHPTCNAAVNEAFVALPIGLVWPYRRFKTLHLRHHQDERLTDPFDDPESYYKARWRHEHMPKIVKAILRLNNMMIVRIVLGPVLAVTALVWGDLQSIWAGDRKIARAWLIHTLCAMPVLWLVQAVFEMPLWLYVLVPVWVGHGIISIRTYAEHQWNETPDGRTIIVEKSVLSFLFLNNNLHLVHHNRPRVPWYDLPAEYRSDRAAWIEKNRGYVFPNYLSLLRNYAFKAKEPVIHPEWRMDVEQPFIFLPKGHRHSGR